MKKIYRLWDAADSAVSEWLNKAFCREKTTRCGFSAISLSVDACLQGQQVERVNVMSEARLILGGVCVGGFVYGEG